MYPWLSKRVSRRYWGLRPHIVTYIPVIGSQYRYLSKESALIPVLFRRFISFPFPQRSRLTRVERDNQKWWLLSQNTIWWQESQLMSPWPLAMKINDLTTKSQCPYASNRNTWYISTHLLLHIVNCLLVFCIVIYSMFQCFRSILIQLVKEER